ncbi:MAG: hypothetical protein EHM39_14480 [Chloroflexi bacterium]|nr:MAG: hypothetical protein EHM39_14480 [Chloroflexota bacterium]
MTDKLETVVDNVLTRLLLLEPLACTDASYATKRWIEIRQDAPYWVNRIASLADRGPEDLPTYDLGIDMRLILAFQSGVVREDNIDGNPQVKAWAYAPRVVRYFRKNQALALAGQAALTHIDIPNVRITLPRGLDLQVLPLSREIMLAIDFNLIVPLQVGDQE